MKNRVLLKIGCLMLAICATCASSPAQAGRNTPTTTFTTLLNFDYSNGGNPAYESLVEGLDGNFYGTTSYESDDLGNGTVFKITPSGTLTTLYTFDFSDGAQPEGGLVLASNGNFYGTTYAGGTFSDGTVFEITPSGTLTTVHSFDPSTDGGDPYAAVIQASDGNLYGTAPFQGPGGGGTVFKINPSSGMFTVLYSFGTNGGGTPYGGLVQGSNGDLYGTTYTGTVTTAYGTVFKITTSGVYTLLHSFVNTDGARPWSSLVQGTDGNLYGTTTGGGSSYEGTVFQVIPSTGALTTLHNFVNSDGSYPTSALIQATDGNFYGTTQFGGTYGYGTIFKITSGGTFTSVYSFPDTSGTVPYGGLLQATDGDFYGTTYEGGTDHVGSVFSLSVGLRPFLKLLPASGKEGATITILGGGLSGATGVSFDGTAATDVTIVSDSEILVQVPAGAETGKVKVTTASGSTISSSASFKVTPTIFAFAPPSGLVGTTVIIAGTGFLQTTKVTFNGKVATFAAPTDTQITATVPVGATTGKIAITTKGGTTRTATNFTVN
jgi:uncharacterized repeat protein (TIGR03803 family)